MIPPPRLLLALAFSFTGLLVMLIGLGLGIAYLLTADDMSLLLAVCAEGIGWSLLRLSRLSWDEKDASR